MIYSNIQCLRNVPEINCRPFLEINFSDYVQRHRGIRKYFNYFHSSTGCSHQKCLSTATESICFLSPTLNNFSF